MNADEAALVRHQIGAAEARTKAAEARADKAESDASRLRALLTRVRTSLGEVHNDPVHDGRPAGGGQ